MDPAEKRRLKLYPSQRYEQERLRRTAKLAYIRNHKAAHGCLTCGERDPVVLDLHHRDPGQKKRNQSRVSGIDWASMGWKALERELEKCDVLCANCHRRLTFAEMGWI